MEDTSLHKTVVHGSHVGLLQLTVIKLVYPHRSINQLSCTGWFPIFMVDSPFLWCLRLYQTSEGLGTKRLLSLHIPKKMSPLHAHSCAAVGSSESHNYTASFLRKISHGWSNLSDRSLSYGPVNQKAGYQIAHSPSLFCWIHTLW